MSKLIDETGNQYGYLTVIKRVENISGRAVWECQCKCGKIINVQGVALRNGHTKSCGCYQKEQTSKACVKDLVGQTINNFTILESIQGTKKHHHSWRCRCNLCGNENIIISTTNLYNQYSCGCSIESKGERKIKNILEKLNINFVQEKRFNDCKFENGKSARFDFYLPKLNILIEYDGIQHFKEGKGVFDNADKFKQTQERDAFKNKWCEENNISLIRIPYYDYDFIDDNYLLAQLEKCITT